MIYIDRITAMHSPANKAYKLRLDFVTYEGKLAYLAHLKNCPFDNLYAKGEKSFLKRNCSLGYGNVDELFLPDDLVVKWYVEEGVLDKSLVLEFGEEENNMPDNIGVPICAIGDARTIFNITILNIWVNKKKDIVVVELARKGVTKKIKVHKEKGVKFDVYAAVCAAMAIFEYGSNSALKREIERKVHYVESK